MHDVSQSANHAYLERITTPFVLPTNVYGAMLVIWHLRQPLQHRFPLHLGQARDYVRFLAWCANEGRREYAILRSISEWDTELSQPIALPLLRGDRWTDSFSVDMFFVGVAHCHYTFGAMLGDARVREIVALAFWRGERHARYAPPPALWQGEFLLRKFGSMDRLVGAIRLGKHDAGRSNAQLLERFHLGGLARKFPDNPDFRSCPLDAADLQVSRPVVAHLPDDLRRSRVLVPNAFRPTAAVMEWLNPKPSEFQVSMVTRLVPVARRRRPRVVHPFGVNLFGYARGELGTGEDVRLVAAALEAQQIPFCIVNVEPGREISQKDRSVEHRIVDQAHYGINLFCLTGVEQARLACEKGVDAFDGRYNIGLSPWELPNWPSSCQYTHGTVDEIWGISNYTAQAFSHAPHPVHVMTLPVAIDSIAELRRADFGLPEKPYLFVFAFDINSSVSRKNPESVIRAFQKAFPRESAEEVGLVLKVNTADASSGSLSLLDRVDLYLTKHRAWHNVRRLAVKDPRIHVIERGMRRPNVLALYRACDCFVSLHRAEGFGRCLAEAMLLNLQVIATGFSGNMDFCEEPRVGLARYRLRPLRADEYFWSDGQMWAEPDIDHAAELMRSIREKPRNTAHGFDFSPAAVGLRYARRLREIQEEFNIQEETDESLSRAC